MSKLFWKENGIWYVHPVVVLVSSVWVGLITVGLLMWLS